MAEEPHSHTIAQIESKYLLIGIVTLSIFVTIVVVIFVRKMHRRHQQMSSRDERLIYHVISKHAGSSKQTLRNRFFEGSGETLMADS